MNAIVDRWYEDVCSKGRAKPLHESAEKKIAGLDMSKNRSKIYRAFAEPKSTPQKTSIDSLDGVLGMVFGKST